MAVVAGLGDRKGLWFFVNEVACRGLLWLIGNELRKWRSYKRK
jgi:hypothetical protein